MAMVKPEKNAAHVSQLIAEANRREWSPYKLKAEAGVTLRTAQRFLAGDLNPTASTVEAIALALGMRIKAEAKKIIPH